MKTKEAYTDPWIMHLLTRDLWTNNFCGNNCSLFLEILASLKLVNYTKLDVKPAHSTCLLLKDWELTTATVNQEGLESSLSRCVTHGISRHQNGGFCMFCEMWLEFVFLCDTCLAFAFLREKWLHAFFCECEAVFRIFCDAWEGQLLMHEIVFRRGIGDPLVSVYYILIVKISKKIEIKQFNLLS